MAVVSRRHLNLPSPIMTSRGKDVVVFTEQGNQQARVLALELKSDQDLPHS